MDPYSVLGVSKTASQEEIKKAYRRLAMEFHPDRNPSPEAEGEFKKVSEAHSLIGTPDARKEYDSSQFQPRHSFDDIFSGFRGHEHPTQSWEDLFGAFSSHRQAPYVIRSSLAVTLEEISSGARKVFVLDGQRVDFQVPPTVRPGDVLSLNLQGGQQLQMNIQLKQHGLFSLTGDDLFGSVVVPVDVAIRGGEVKAPTLDNAIMLRIPPGTSSHQKLRAKGVGLPLKSGGRSSIVYEIIIDVSKASEELNKWSVNI